MKTLVFATNNAHKLAEVKQLVGDRFRILSLQEANVEGEIPETGTTLEANALEKVQFIYNRLQLPCFSDDTGLEIAALDQRPGVYSARYAGSSCSAEDNMDKVLAEMEPISNREARFRTVIALIVDGQEQTFDGTVNGTILPKRQGEEGFGYDPIFQPEGETRSFAQMSSEEKNSMSHRGRATRKLADYLLEQFS